MKAVDIEKKRLNRFIVLYELYKYSETKPTNLQELSYKKEIKNGIFEAVHKYLDSEKLIANDAGVKYNCTITHAGIKAIEAAILHPDKATELFPPFNEIGYSE